MDDPSQRFIRATMSSKVSIVKGFCWALNKTSKCNVHNAELLEPQMNQQMSSIKCDVYLKVQ